MSMRVLAGLVLAGLTSVPVWGNTTNGVDPQAEAVLRSLSAYFLAASSFKVDLQAETRIEAQDMKQEFTTHGNLAVKRPDKLAMTVKNSMIGSMFLACDGTNFTAYLPAFNRYTVKPSGGSLEQLSKDMGASSPAFLPVISALLEQDPYQAFVKNASRVQYVGEEKRGDVACHHVKFFHKDFDCDAWIRTGPKPLLEAVKPCLAALGCASNMPPGMKTDVILQFKDWEVSTNLPDSLFAISLPAEAQKVDSLCPAVPDKEPEEADPAEALRSKPAPVFKLPLLGGGEFDLAAQKGKSAVVLCFWTTWAGPCHLALPMLEKEAAAFKDKGVVVVSINQQESEAAIREFIQNNGVTQPVAIDRNSDVAELYRVEGVPQIVVIDQSGLVRDIYLGYGKSLGDDLRGTLEALTAKPATAP
jgi:peroxiredoxin